MTPEPQSRTLEKLATHDLLSAEDERRLGKIIQSERNEKKKKAALDEFVRCNMRLVMLIARDFSIPGVETDDLISEGAIGLQKAAQRFKPSAGVRFCTYGSWWIRQSMMRYIANSARTIRIPVHRLDGIRRLSRIQAKLAEELGRDPSNEEIAEATGMEVGAVERLLLSGANTVSLDSPYGDDAGTLGDVIPDTLAKDPSEVAQTNIEVARVNSLLEGLNARERNIISDRFGLGEKDPLTLEEVGLKWNVTRERIRQIQNITLKKLRRQIERTRTIIPEIRTAALQIQQPRPSMIKSSSEALQAPAKQLNHRSPISLERVQEKPKTSSQNDVLMAPSKKKKTRSTPKGTKNLSEPRPLLAIAMAPKRRGVVHAPKKLPPVQTAVPKKSKHSTTPPAAKHAVSAKSRPPHSPAPRKREASASAAQKLSPKKSKTAPPSSPKKKSAGQKVAASSLRRKPSQPRKDAMAGTTSSKESQKKSKGKPTSSQKILLHDKFQKVRGVIEKFMDKNRKKRPCQTKRKHP